MFRYFQPIEFQFAAEEENLFQLPEFSVTELYADEHFIETETSEEEENIFPFAEPWQANEPEEPQQEEEEFVPPPQLDWSFHEDDADFGVFAPVGWQFFPPVTIENPTTETQQRGSKPSKKKHNFVSKSQRSLKIVTKEHLKKYKNKQ